MVKWLVVCLLVSMVHYGTTQPPQHTTRATAPVLSTSMVVVAFKGDNPSFTLSFNQTTYGPDAKFYTTNSQRSIVERIPGKQDIVHSLPSTFESVILGNFSYTDTDNNRTTKVYTAAFTTPLLNESNSALAILEASVFLFENATTYNFTLPASSPSNTNNNTQQFSVSLSDSSVLIFTRVKNWRFSDPNESLQVRGNVKASSGPLSVSFSKYGDPTNNLRSVVLRGGIEAVVVHLRNNATLSCSGRVASAYVDISYSITSYNSPIGADISFSFPSFYSAFGNDTQALCGGDSASENYIEYYAYMTLDNEENPISWILVGLIAAGGVLIFCCLVSVVLVVRCQYNKIIARKDDEEQRKEAEEEEKERKEEEEARRKLLKKKEEQGDTTVYTHGYYDYLLKKPIEDLEGATTTSLLKKYE